MSRRDFALLSVLAACVVLQFAPILFTGHSYFFADLTLFYHPWQALPAEMMLRGVFPHWDPYAYLGMPLHGIFQTGTFSPSSLPFRFFPTAWALKAQLVLSHGLAAFFGYLWLRRWGRAAGLAGGALWALGGFMLVHVGFTGWAWTLALWPAMFLFAGSPVALGVASAAALSAGYPPLWAGMTASLAVLPWGPKWKDLAKSTAIALGLTAAMLLPGLEMIRASDRGSPTRYEDRVLMALSPRDVGGFVNPALTTPPTPGSEYEVWRRFHVGALAAGLAVLGAASLGAIEGAWVAAFLLTAVLALFGSGNPVSDWMWRHLPPLQFLRHPAHLSYLPLAALIPLAGLGLRRRRWAGIAALALVLELLWLGRGLQPTIGDAYWDDRGPLAAALQEDLDGHRYFPSPQAARSLFGSGPDIDSRYRDVRHRLYGNVNLPLHLPAAAALGESLLLAGSVAVMDHMFSLKSATAAARYLPWLDASVMMTPERPAGMSSERLLWHLTRIPDAARARWVPAGQPLDAGFERAPEIRGAVPVDYRSYREDRTRIQGTAPAAGSLFIADPLYPGWESWLNGERVRAEPALGAFQRVAVGPGPFRLEQVYRPRAFPAGAWVSLTVLLGLCGWGRLRLRREAGRA